ncbi:hypothetical protein [Paraburkholderia sp.]|uniref:hypothetical protein n=1 Tax=Paraburkholderia sp. TaxID=1926495 RepID=UPI003D6E494D
MSTYIYSGPTTGLTLRASDGAHVERMLFHGAPVELPDCAEVRTLVALKRLSLQPDAVNVAPVPAAAPTVVQPSASDAPADAAAAASATATAPATKSKGA